MRWLLGIGVALILLGCAYPLIWRSTHEDWPTLSEAREAITEAYRDTVKDVKRWMPRN